VAAELIDRAASEATLQDAVPVILTGLVDATAWTAATLWMPDPRSGALRCAGFATSAAARTKAFERRCRETTFEHGHGLPGRVWRSRVPVVPDSPVPDVRFEGLDPDATPSGVLAFPLVSDDDFVGVVELIDTEEHIADLTLQRALAVLGAEWGRSIRLRAIRESAGAAAARLEAALAAGRMGIWDWDPRTGNVVWSETLEQILGLDPGTFGGTIDDFLGFVHPSDRDWALEVFSRALERAGDHTIDVEYRAVGADGRTLWLQVVGKTLLDPAGRVQSMTGVAVDITERIGREEVNRMDAALLDLALETAGVGAFRWYRGSRTGWWSASLVQILGTGPEGGGEVTSDDALAVLHPEDQWALDATQAGSEEHRDFHARYRIVRPDGEVRWVETRGRPLHDIAGDLVGIAGVVVDVTDEPAV
jgi:PAS domain S-box-containing protein